MSEKRIDINVPVLARVEGEGALQLSIENNAIQDLKLRIYEPPRYFEKFLEGRSYKEVVDIVARICGICPIAYQMSAIQAIESIFGYQPSTWVRDMRRLMYCGEWIQSHSMHIHMLAAPDFLGFKSVIEMSQEHAAEVQRGLRLQSLGHDLIKLLGGRSVHPVNVCAGGFYSAVDEKEVAKLLKRFEQARQDAADLVAWVSSLELTQDEQDFTSVSLRHPDEYAINAGHLVSDQGLDIRINKFEQHFHEFQVVHSTALHSLLDDKPYLVGPLARLNNNFDQLPEQTRELLDSTGVRFPSANMFHSIIARALEIHFAINEAIRLMQAYQQPELSFDPVAISAGIGFGCTEAPRGILWHRYELDQKGTVTSARIVPPTSQNQARIEQDIENALMSYGLDKTDADLQLHAEKVIRNYDPCISCATHFLTMHVKRKDDKTLADAVLTPKLGSITLIAIGSPIYPDDISWRLVDKLKKEISDTALNIVKLDRPGSNLLNYLPQQGDVVLLDAVVTDDLQQELIELDPAHQTAKDSRLSSHQVGLADALALAETVGISLKHVTVLGIAVHAELAADDINLAKLVQRLKTYIPGSDN